MKKKKKTEKKKKKNLFERCLVERRKRWWDLDIFSWSHQFFFFLKIGRKIRGENLQVHMDENDHVQDSSVDFFLYIFVRLVDLFKCIILLSV